MRYVNYHSYQSVENVLVYRYPAINTYVKYLLDVEIYTLLDIKWL